MFRSKLITIGSPVLVIGTICLILVGVGESKSILGNLALPPAPENRAISQQLELLLQNGTGMECSAELESGYSPRNGIIGSRYRWSTFNVFVDPAYNDRERTLINNAVDRLRQAVPCLSFGVYPPGARPSGDYVHIKKGAGCWSYVGKRGGAQDVSLQSPGCMYVGTIMHELIHALGKEHNFLMRSASQVTTFGVRYNQRGIMHYGGRDFSKNGQPTISAKNGGVVGPTQNLEPSDIEKLRKMYNC